LLNIVKEQKDNALNIILTGSIEESVDFDKLIGDPAPVMHVNCKAVPRINSVGVKAWIKYFKRAQESGSKIKLIECSIAIVEQLNLISNFSCGAEVESIQVPFACESCGAELAGLFKVTALKDSQLNIPPLKCPKCSGQAVFDDIPEEYFNFLED